MIFGITNELSPYKDLPECRAGLSPMGVHELVLAGAKVYIENKAGEKAGFTDSEYEQAGGTIVYSKEEVYQRSDIILKVRCPQSQEYKWFKEGQTILGFIHLFTSPKEFPQIIEEKDITLIGYEIIQKNDGRFPIVTPMSEIAGKLSVQIAGRLLESPGMGRGILLGGIPGVPPAVVVILGAGTLGNNAAISFAGIGANVYILDIERDKLEILPAYTSGMKITTLFSTRQNIEKMVRIADVIIGAAALPRKRTPILVTGDMVSTMKQGAVIIDFSIDQGGCIETAKISPEGDFIYTVDDVIHFCMPNTTTIVARTATHALTSVILPYLKLIIQLGVERAINEVPGLIRGILAEKGQIRKEFLL